MISECLCGTASGDLLRVHEHHSCRDELTILLLNLTLFRPVRSALLKHYKTPSLKKYYVMVYSEGGWNGLNEEIQMEVKRISSRNLGRDDRVISDHSREARIPFLDENVVRFLSSLPIHVKVCFYLLLRSYVVKLTIHVIENSGDLHFSKLIVRKIINT